MGRPPGPGRVPGGGPPLHPGRGGWPTPPGPPGRGGCPGAGRGPCPVPEGPLLGGGPEFGGPEFGGAEFGPPGIGGRGAVGRGAGGRGAGGRGPDPVVAGVLGRGCWPVPEGRPVVGTGSDVVALGCAGGCRSAVRTDGSEPVTGARGGRSHGADALPGDESGSMRPGEPRSPAVAASLADSPSSGLDHSAPRRAGVRFSSAFTTSNYLLAEAEGCGRCTSGRQDRSDDEPSIGPVRSPTRGTDAATGGGSERLRWAARTTPAADDTATIPPIRTSRYFFDMPIGCQFGS